MTTLVFLSLYLASAAAGKEPPRPAITALAFAPGGKALVYGSQKGAIHRAAEGAADDTLPARLDHVLALAFSPDGSMLAVAGGSPAESGAVELLSWPARKPLRRLEGHGDVIHAVAWLDGGKKLATASADRTVRIWDAATGKALHKLTGHSGPVLALAASSDSKLLCSGSADQTIRVWDPATGKLLRSLTNHLGPVHQLAFRPGLDAGAPPQLVSAAGDATVRVWQPGIGRMVRIVRQPGPVLAIAWTKDGGKILAGGTDGTLRILDGDSDRVEREHRLSKSRITSLAVSPADGRALAGSAGGELLATVP